MLMLVRLASKEQPPMMQPPTDLLYSEHHMWARLNGATATIGLTHRASDTLGEVAEVELPPLGTRLREGIVFGAAESFQQSCPLVAPVTGEVVAVNHLLEGAPATVAEAPYESGWLLEVRLAEDPEEHRLLSASSYAALFSSGVRDLGHVE